MVLCLVGLLRCVWGAVWRGVEGQTSHAASAEERGAIQKIGLSRASMDFYTRVGFAVGAGEWLVAGSGDGYRAVQGVSLSLMDGWRA